MKIISKIKWLLFNCISFLPIPLRFYSTMEFSLATLQGKGWGSGSIKQEVDSCLSILQYPPKVFIDIGAHHGLYTKQLLQKFPDIECHLFEPSSRNIKVLKDEFGISKKILVNQYALSNKKTKAKLYSNTPGSVIGSLTKRRLDHFKRLEHRGYDWEMNEIEEVNLIRFDNYWDENKYIDFVKIDVEGHELEVLQGFGNLIKITKLIQFEFGGCNIDTRTFFQDFWYFFQEMNFLIYRITPRGWSLIEFYSPREENFMTTNYETVNQNV
jgi:methyltransferase, FkbM family